MCASRWLVRAGLMKFRTNCCKHLTRVRYFVQQQKTRTGNDRSSSRPREQSRCDKPAVNVSIPLQGRLYCYHKKKKEMNKIGGREHEKMENCFFFSSSFWRFRLFLAFRRPTWRRRTASWTTRSFRRIASWSRPWKLKILISNCKEPVTDDIKKGNS